MKEVLLPSKLWSLILFLIPLVSAPIKKKPIINHISLSRKIKGEKACPDLIISVRGSNGSKLLTKLAYFT